jgi:transposase-like protein
MEEQMKQKHRRKSTKLKIEIVLRLLRGESIEELAREFKIPVHQISCWRDEFMKAGSHGLKKNPDESRMKEAQRVIGRLAMENELLKKKIEFNQRIQGK